MITPPVPNGTPDFFRARRGCLTASTISLATARRGGSWGISRARLMGRLVKERLTGHIEPTFCSPAMRWGIAHEGDAREAYEARTGAHVMPGGFLRHPRYRYAGASPDGLVMSAARMAGIVEIKCPQAQAFDEIAHAKLVPRRYFKQIAWQLATTSAGWCDFAVWMPRRPLIILRLMRNDLAAQIATLEAQAEAFLMEAAKMEASLKPFFQKDIK